MNSKSLVIVTSNKDNTGTVSLKAAAEKQGVDVQVAVIFEDDVAALVNSADRAIFRINPKTYHYYEMLRNDVEARYRQKIDGALASFDKAATYDILHRNNIATPMGYRLARGEQIGAFPVVIKVLHGNQGNGVALLKSQADFDAFVAGYDEEIYFVQDFIEQAAGHDKRLFIAGSKLLGAMERSATTDDFRANLHQGGQAAAYNPTNQEVELAQRAANAFGVDFVGVDIIDSSDGPMVLEVNPSPGLKIGEIIGVDIAEKIIEELFHD